MSEAGPIPPEQMRDRERRAVQTALGTARASPTPEPSLPSKAKAAEARSAVPVRLTMVLDAHCDAVMGGAQYQAKCLLDLLKRRACFSIHYAARFVPAEREHDGYRIVRFGTNRNHGRLRMLMDLPSLYRALEVLRPHIVYQRCLLPFTGVCAWYCRRRGAKLIFHIAHDRDVTRPAQRQPGLHGLLHAVARRIGEFGMRRADAIIAQTEWQARTLRAEYGLDATLVVRNFQPVPPERERDRVRGPVRIIWVANFKPFKHPELFVDLAEALAERSDIEFVMAGRPGPRARFAALHERIARLANLRYLGELPVERIDEELAASDIFVNTSRLEGFPNTFIQAWLRSVPVVSCFVDPDACLSRGGAGIFVGGSEQLAQAVTDLIDDRSRLLELGRNARAYAIRHHTPQGAEPLVELLVALGGGAAHDRFLSSSRPGNDRRIRSARARRDDHAEDC